MKKFLYILFRIIFGFAMICLALGPALAFENHWLALLWIIFPGSIAMVGLESAINGSLDNDHV